MLRDRARYIVYSTNALLKHSIPSVETPIHYGRLAGRHSLFIDAKQQPIEVTNIDLHRKRQIARRLKQRTHKLSDCGEDHIRERNEIARVFSG